jgi:hypothetical protein
VRIDVLKRAEKERRCLTFLLHLSFEHCHPMKEGSYPLAPSLTSWKYVKSGRSEDRRFKESREREEVSYLLAPPLL